MLYSSSLPSAEVLRAAFFYNAQSGRLTYQGDSYTPTMWKRRKVERHFPEGEGRLSCVDISFLGGPWGLVREARLIWKLVTKREVLCRVSYVDGDNSNLAWQNLRCTSMVLPTHVDPSNPNQYVLDHVEWDEERQVYVIRRPERLLVGRSSPSEFLVADTKKAARCAHNIAWHYYLAER